MNLDQHSTTMIANAGTDQVNDLTSIFVAARQDFSVEGLIRILSDNTGNHVLACVEPGEHCWEKLKNLQPDILLLHEYAVESPKREQFARIKTTVPGIGIIIFGQRMDDDFLMDLIRAGASGYLNENMGSSDLITAIRAVAAGRLWIEPRLMESFARTAIEFEHTLEKQIAERLGGVRRLLTKGEIAVFQLLLEGMTTKEIAAHIHRSEQSVKMHLGRIFRKFSVTSRSQLILEIYSRICPVQNLIRVIRSAFGSRRLEREEP